MDGKSVKFVCPHCNEAMEVDMIYFHVRGIFNSPLYKCRQCDFSTNGTFNRDHHKLLTGHQLDYNNNHDPFLQEAINSTTTMFMNSVVRSSGSTSAIENVDKPKDAKKIDSLKQPTGGNENSINTVSVKRISDSEQKRKFFLDTINSINSMSFKYERNNINSRGVEVIKISTGQKYNVLIPSFGKNKMTMCRKCGEEVHESYLSRRRHVFLEHKNDIKDQLKDLKRLKKTDILFKGFMNIHDCFPEYAVCSDFQCVECGHYHSSLTGRKYHVNARHQNIITIDYPYENYDFKTGSGYNANDHIKTDMKKNVDKKHVESTNNLERYVSAPNHAKFNSSCELGNQIAEKMLKHYFPICFSNYDNFQDDFKKDLYEFRRSYLKPYVLNDLNTDNQRMDKDEIILISQS